METKFCYETYCIQSDNGDVIPHTTESQPKSEGSF